MYKILHINFSLIKYPKIMSSLKKGHDLFTKYNYYLLVVAFIISESSTNLIIKLNHLNIFYNQNNIDYKNFIETIQDWLISIDLIIALTYIYTLFAYIFYNLENKSKTIDYHPLIINIIYFVILSFILSSTKSHEKDWEQSVAIGISIMDTMVFIFLIMKKKCLWVITKPFLLILKIFFLITIAYFVLNVQYVVLTYKLLQKQFYTSIKQNTHDLLKTQNFILKDSYIDKNNN